jgi:hypothetical protein
MVNTSGHVLINAGLMEGSGSGGLVFVSRGVANTATIVANAGSSVTIQSSTVDNAGGGVTEATAAGSQIRLSSGTIVNGTLTIGASGSLNNVGGSSPIDNADFNKPAPSTSATTPPWCWAARSTTPVRSR